MCRSERSTRVREYWDYTYEPPKASHAAQVDALRTAIEQSVGRQLVSDVPLGAFFSGEGILGLHVRAAEGESRRSGRRAAYGDRAIGRPPTRERCAARSVLLG